MEKKISDYRQQAVSLYLSNPDLSSTQIADKICESFGLEKKESHGRSIRRWISSVKVSENHEALSQECDNIGLPIEDVKQYWYKGEHFSINLKGGEKEKTYFDVRDEIVESMKSHAPRYEKIKYSKVEDPHMLLIDPADVHIGKLATSFETGEDYNSQIAVNRVLTGVEGLLKKAQGFPVDQIAFIIGNDILHIDTPKRTTTSGTPQDTDGMWYDNFLIAKRLYVECIEMLATIAPVRVVYNPSNHDYTNGFFLADSISAWFRNFNAVEFDVSIRHRKYFSYGKNLIGTSHGDGAKIADLPFLMAQEAAQMWAESIHRYFFIHHFHHKISKDYGTVCVESLRTPSGTDGWHDRNGYVGAPKAIEAFIMHPIHGQVARLTHTF